MERSEFDCERNERPVRRVRRINGEAAMMPKIVVLAACFACP
jgi:hypothetical protein